MPAKDIHTIKRHADWARCIAHRDKQLRGAVLLQRAVRRFLNQTYERDAAARLIQAFVRRRVLCWRRGEHLPRRSGEENQTRQQRCGGKEESWRRTNFDRRRENWTILPSTARRRGGGGDRGATPEEEDIEADDQDDQDDQDDIMYGRPPGGARWSVSSGGSDGSVYNVADVTHSSVLLSDSNVSLCSTSTSSGEGDGGRGGGRRGENVGGLPPQYDVFLWHHKQHALVFTQCPISGWPRVLDSSAANVSVPGMWHVRDGDVLLSINDCSTHVSELSLAEVEQVLDSGVRPAILRFRRPSTVETLARGKRERGGGDNQSSVQGASSWVRRDMLQQRERSEASLCYVIWREEVPALGIRFQHPKGKPYPEVEAVWKDSAALRRGEVREGGGGGGGEIRVLSPSVQPGDYLLSINDWGVRDAKFDHVLDVLHHAPRPLVLTFRRVHRVTSADPRTYEL